MAAQNHVGSIDQNAVVANEQLQQIADVSLQRRAMLAMVLAMAIMVIGLPLHASTLRTHGAHSAASWMVAWPSCLLTIWTLWAVRHVLQRTWRTLCRAQIDSAALVTICALIAFIASCPALVNHNVQMYFDVTAMSLAWIVAGEAQTAALSRRFASTVGQLAPLNLHPQLPALPAAARNHQSARWLAVAILAFALAALGCHALLSDNIAAGLLAGLSVFAVGCPCTLGIVKSSAWEAGVERAASLGWLMPSGAAFSSIAAAPHLACQFAIAPGTADLAALLALARAVDRTIRRNYLWAIGLNLVLLPLALVTTIPAIVPAAMMVLARLLIFFATWRLRSGCHAPVQSR